MSTEERKMIAHSGIFSLYHVRGSYIVYLETYRGQVALSHHLQREQAMQDMRSFWAKHTEMYPKAEPVKSFRQQKKIQSVPTHTELLESGRTVHWTDDEVF